MENKDKLGLRDQGTYTDTDRSFLDVWVPSIVFVCTLCGFAWILGSGVGWPTFWWWTFRLGVGAAVVAAIGLCLFLYTGVKHSDVDNQDD